VRTEFAEALHQAAAEGRREAVEILVELGVPIDRPGQMQGTPLHHAAWWGHGDVVAALLAPRRGPGCARPNGGATPLVDRPGSFHPPGRWRAERHRPHRIARAGSGRVGRAELSTRPRRAGRWLEGGAGAAPQAIATTGCRGRLRPSRRARADGHR
jgi:ankyrin repeat protein